ncbi:unnamed protein product [Prorocentrum cordatum]|uniref:Cellulase n=1 Tax=Prorocentrum cordatum TaxID=2364126 RepID=A0ABN9V7A0_9DINO|nr:unnamed protein product [Polarella glacialis]
MSLGALHNTCSRHCGGSSQCLVLRGPVLRIPPAGGSFFQLEGSMLLDGEQGVPYDVYIAVPNWGGADCNAGYNDLDPLQWVRGWSGAKKLYCCKTANKGCPSELPPPSGKPPSGLPPAPDSSEYDCDAGYHHCMHCLKLSWSPRKIDYCCRTQHRGCQGEEPE